MPENEQPYAVEMKSITKTFGSNRALAGVNLKVKKGTIHALLGENGAGKTTLMSILYGLYPPDSGEIWINGTRVEMKNPNVAIAHKIGMVHQHFMLVENFTVTQNIILGREVTHAFGVLDNAKAKREVESISKKYGLAVDPDAKIEDISVGMQQRVEILKALYRGVDILILDEPTAVLTPQEIDELISIMHNLIADGKTIIIITHKLKEIKKSSDVCTIIRRGEYVDTVNVKDVDEEMLASMMVGRKVNLVVPKKKAEPAQPVLEIKGLTVEDARKIEKVKNMSLCVRRGEIVGIAGIDGNGQSELVEAITCLTHVKTGTIEVGGEQIQNTTPHNVLKHGVRTVHEDRQKRGLVLDFPVHDNLILENYGLQPYSKHGVLQRITIRNFAQEMIKKFDIRPASCADAPARSLSGGNQQKVVIAREVSDNPDLLIAVQPTRGLDVGAIEYIHRALIEQRDAGRAILLISLELDEVMNVSDRICVIYDGHIVGEFDQSEANEQKIGLLMAGGGKTDEG